MTRRGAIAGAVLVAWAAGFALLLSRELHRSMADRVAEAALRVVPTTTWYRVDQDGSHIGFASIEIDTAPRTIEVTEYMVLDSKAGSRITDQTVTRLSRALALRGFEHLRGVGADTTALAGQLLDSSLVIRRSGSAVADTLRVAAPVFAGAIAPTVAVLLEDPRVGSSVAFSGVDPARGVAGPLTLRYDAESLFVVVDSAVADASGRWFAVHRDTVRAWHVASSGDGLAIDAWLDAQGLIVESRRGDGLVLRRTAFELAFENWRQANPARAVPARAGGTVVPATWLASGAARPTAIIDRLELRVRGDVPREVAAFLGGRLRPGATRTLTRLAPGQLRSRYDLPTTARWREAFRKELAASAVFPLDDPAIGRRAARLRGTESDPLVVVRRIVDWVHDSMTVRRPETAGTARDAVTGGGDAREFALAVTALARAAGIPSHTRSGLLYHDGRFFVHAWNEVYTGHWIPVDGMLGQVPADAGHLAFAQDAVDLGPDLARILTRLDLEATQITVADTLASVPRTPSPVPRPLR